MGLVIGNSLVTGAIYALMALGLVVVYKTTKVFNFAHGMFSGLCGYLAYQSAVVWDLPFPVSVLLAVAAGTVIGFTVADLRRRAAARCTLGCTIY